MLFTYHNSGIYVVNTKRIFISKQLKRALKISAKEIALDLTIKSAARLVD